MSNEHPKVKTYRVVKAYLDNKRIEAFEDGKNILDIIVADYEVAGAMKALESLGYRCTRREY